MLITYNPRKGRMICSFHLWPDDIEDLTTREVFGVVVDGPSPLSEVPKF